jgi:hypothetical protein
MNLADCEVDSLLLLIIASRFRNELDLEVENESLFMEHPTVRDLKRVLLGKPENAVTVNPVAHQSMLEVESQP